MEEKKTFGEKLEAFFAGKGFYIVLFLCVAVIGVSAWSMLTGKETDVETSGDTLEAQEDGGSVPTGLTEYPAVNDASLARPTATPAPTPEATVQPQAPAAAEIQETEQAVSAYFIWPVTGEVDTPYSMAALTYSTTMQDWRTHDGVDICAQLGDQVKAASSGTVEAVYEDDLLGTVVVIRHGGGLTSTYANLAATPTVAVGDAVATGQVIGAVGDTALGEIGQVTHLHFAMARDGESVDPEDYMP